MSAHIHMITGLTGAGKSTYAHKLAADLGGVRMSVDDWNANLFFMDRDPTTDFDWFYERVQRCCRQMRNTAEQVLAANVPVIFDCGFTNFNERNIFYRWADELGYDAHLHYVDVDKDLCWQRVQERNRQQGKTFALTVSREMFDFMETIWEAPSSEEMTTRFGLRIN